MTSLAKMLTVLDLFAPSTSLLSADEIAARLGYSRTTSYRYLQILCASGLLSRFSGGYTLGPRAIELDYVIRSSDPLLNASEPVMAALRDRYGCNVQLFSMFNDRIIAVQHVRGTDPVVVSWGRGRATPIFLGAGGRAIMASLPQARAKTLFERHREEAQTAGLGPDWPAFRDQLKAIRRAGYCISVGELDPHNAGIAAPIALSAPTLPSSLVMVLSRRQFELIDRQAAADVVREAANRIVEALHLRELPELMK